MSDRGNSLRERVRRYGTGTATRVRDLQAQLPAVAVPYEVRGMHLPVKPRLLGYWIPFVAGVGLMVAGMKTARVPFVGVPQLVLGVVLIALTSWNFLSDSGRLGVRSSPPQPPPAAPPALSSTRIRKTYDEGFRRHAVDMVRSTGQPIAAIARELDVAPSTLASWVRKDRQERERLGVLPDGS